MATCFVIQLIQGVKPNGCRRIFPTVAGNRRFGRASRFMSQDTDQPFKPLTTEQARDFQELDEAFFRLSELRVATVERESTDPGAALAMQISMYRQATLRHILMTARGVRVCWNARNLLASFVLTRSLTETIALFDAFERRLSERFDQSDIVGMETLVSKLTLSGDDLDLEIDDGTRIRIIMGAIHELERRHQIRVRDNYVRLIERCDPRLVVQHSVHRTVDRSLGSVDFSDTNDVVASSECLLMALSLLLVFEGSLNVIDDLIRQTPDLQRGRRRV